MPVKKTGNSYQWGSGHGKFKTKAEAEAQGRAAYANGYKGDSRTKDCADMVKDAKAMQRKYFGPDEDSDGDNDD